MKTIQLFFMDSDKNSYKYYTMTQLNADEFLSEWGRLGRDPQSKQYLMSEWDKILSAKIKKGYKQQ